MKTNMEILRSVPKETFEQYIENNISRQEIADIFGMERRSIDRILSELGLTTHGHMYGITKIEETIFDVIDTEEKAYWSGFLFADGCVSDKSASGLSLKLKLAAQDKEHLIKFKNFLKDIRDDETSVRPETAKKDGKEYLQYYYLTYNKHLINSLIKMGCVPRKSLILKFPDESLFANRNLIYDFIRGYVDGDGCIYNERGRISIDMAGTYEFLSKVKEYLPLFPSIIKQGNIYRIKSRGSNGDQIAYKLYEHATIYLDRKFLRYATLCRLHNSETLDKIGESCDANAEVTPEIAKGSESTVENSE